jgi:phage-related tail fiber protein
VQYRPGNLDAHLSGSNSNNIFFSSAVPWNKLNGVLRSAITSLGYNYQRVCYDRLQKLDNSFNAMSLLTAKFAIMKQEIMRDVGVQAVIFPLNDPRKTSIASNKSLKAIFHN